MVVIYDRKKKCLARLLLVHEILLVSTIGNTVLMVKNEKAPKCNCGTETEREFNLNVESLQQIPFHDINRYYYRQVSATSPDEVCWISNSVATIWALLHVRLPTLGICSGDEGTQAVNGMGGGEKRNILLLRGC
uniref:AlNc14C92G5726 protein n=1 Tax=Albugo laibachii Nc14 TaxID=890382 RepID=F0WGJ2_9STRA|nr:AlNc14C92G5726 [Albugo laibachii Nc14]|eukprot:CCA20356.1 AlNc14C92G5726 [Albugo laibachii Nc14]